MWNGERIINGMSRRCTSLPMTAMKQAEPSSPDSPPSDAPSAPQPPPRSRNAKAQARHRAKRKAYIEQLEQTVSRLQAALAVPPEQLGSAHARLHELEQENLRLRTEVELLRAQLGVPNSPVDAVRRGALGFGNSTSDLPGAREGKRRRLSADTVDPNMYLASSTTPSGATGLLSLSSLSSAASAASPYGSSASTTSLLGFPLGTSTTSVAGSPFMASSFSSLPDVSSSSRRSVESFRDPSDAMRLPQAQTPTPQLPPLSYASARRNTENSYNMPFQDTMPNFLSQPPDLDTWKGYSSYARGS